MTEGFVQQACKNFEHKFCCISCMIHGPSLLYRVNYYYRDYLGCFYIGMCYYILLFTELDLTFCQCSSLNNLTGIRLFVPVLKPKNIHIPEKV